MSKIEFIHDFSEVDIAMQQKLSGLFIEDENGQMKEIVPTYFSPDIDLKEVDYPIILFYRGSQFTDYTRATEYRRVIDNEVYNSAGELIQVDVRDFPEPWSVLYTVKFIYRYQIDGVKMNSFIHKKFPRQSVLPVKGFGYNVWLSNSNPERLSWMASAELSGKQYKDFGKTEEGKREFSENFTYRVDLWLDIHDRKTVKTATEINAIVNDETISTSS